MKKLLPILLLTACTTTTGPQITSAAYVQNCEPKGAILAIRPDRSRYAGNGYTAMTQRLQEEARAVEATNIVLSEDTEGSNFLFAHTYKCGGANGK